MRAVHRLLSVWILNHYAFSPLLPLFGNLLTTWPVTMDHVYFPNHFHPREPPMSDILQPEMSPELSGANNDIAQYEAVLSVWTCEGLRRYLASYPVPIQIQAFFFCRHFFFPSCFCYLPKMPQDSTLNAPQASLNGPPHTAPFMFPQPQWWSASISSHYFMRIPFL